jgi:hypothetical protein
MKFAILIYSDEAFWAEFTPDEQQQGMEPWWEYEAALQKEEGVRLAGEALMPTSTAKTIRTKDGKTTTTDGPFAETKEQLGGLYLIDVKDEAEALEWGTRCPGAEWGSIEVRQVQEFEPPQ